MEKEWTSGLSEKKIGCGIDRGILKEEENEKCEFVRPMILYGSKTDIVHMSAKIICDSVVLLIFPFGLLGRWKANTIHFDTVHKRC